MPERLSMDLAATFAAFLTVFERAERLATFFGAGAATCRCPTSPRRRRARDELDFALDFLGFGMLPAEVLRGATH